MTAGTQDLEQFISDRVNEAVERFGLLVVALSFLVGSTVAIVGYLEAGLAGATPATVPLAGGVAALAWWALARRVGARSPYTYPLAFGTALLPVGLTLAEGLAFPEVVEEFAVSPAIGYWLILIPCTGVLIDRWLPVWTSLFCAALYGFMFVLSMPALALLDGPPGLVSLVSFPGHALVRCTMLVVEGFVVGAVAHWTHTLLVRLYREHLSHREASLAQARAEQASETKAALLAHLSHEVRAPLTALAGFAADLQRDPNEAQRKLATLQHGADHVRLLVDDVLTLSRMEVSREQVRNDELVLGDLIRSTLALLGPQACAKGVALTCTLAPDLPARIVSDERRLRQILINLVANALRATSAGEVAVVAERQDDTLALTVRDTGSGIDPAVLLSLFEPFEKGGNSDGHGLGLHICRELAHTLGGEIYAQSTPGVGSKLALKIPLVASALPEMSRKVDLAVPAASELHGLLDLARRGSLQRLASRTQALGEVNPTLVPFAAHIADMVTAVDDRRLIAFLEESLTRPREPED